ncbi:unnamed protein product [Notodromas monacha]|uniref:Uncharacterized protein n=1 Tax=Notodromas monacha TaxID=399045 RepID=A0A7R9GGG9_9CRUS|nr:unnamed protein product [Notodromas monacha]CAG0921693.1 unnamed protein product [Notodromas monacha]
MTTEFKGVSALASKVLPKLTLTRVLSWTKKERGRPCRGLSGSPKRLLFGGRETGRVISGSYKFFSGILEIDMPFISKVASRSSEAIPPFSLRTAFAVTTFLSEVAAVDKNDGIDNELMAATLGIIDLSISRILKGKLGFGKKKDEKMDFSS